MAESIHPVRIVGGPADDSVAERIHAVEEDAYWRMAFSGRPYVTSGEDYEKYRTAYRHGWESRGRYGEFGWEDAEGDVERDWETRRDGSDLSWDEARRAVRDAWDRIDQGLGR